MSFETSDSKKGMGDEKNRSGKENFFRRWKMSIAASLWLSIFLLLNCGKKDSDTQCDNQPKAGAVHSGRSSDSYPVINAMPNVVAKYAEKFMRIINQ